MPTYALTLHSRDTNTLYKGLARSYALTLHPRDTNTLYKGLAYEGEEVPTVIGGTYMLVKKQSDTE
jgi:hypothetical protein